MTNNSGNKLGGKRTAAIILVVCVVFLAIMAIHFVRHRIAYAVTDAVFVRTDSLTTLNFNRVEGRIDTLAKKEGDTVQQGEVIATLDNAVYQLKVERMAAELGAARKEKESRLLQLARLKKEVVLNEAIAGSQVEQLRREEAALHAKAAGVQVVVDQLARDSKRYHALYAEKAVARHKAEDIATDYAVRLKEKTAIDDQAAALGASLKAAQGRVGLAETGRSQIKETSKGIQALEEKIKGLAAALAEAREDLKECVLKSPFTGRVAKRFVSPGSIVSPKKAVYSLVDPKDIYIIVLLEENKLEGVVPGAEATIKIDAYPDKDFKGKVSRVLPASAATFALAPRDISAGEFTKVAQRIPVRIEIGKGDVSLLRVGLGGEVEIKRQKDGNT